MTLRYETVAEHLLTAITQGIYRAGERLPSVRLLSQQHQISTATAVSALRLLEDQGQIEARQRSGYYVRPRLRSVLQEPTMSSPSREPTQVTGQELVLRLVKAANNPQFIQLGAAVPAPSFLPTQKVAQLSATTSRRYRQRMSSYEFPPGAPELRRQIAKRMSEQGCPIDPNDILITNGCQEAMTLALRAITVPGDIVAVESPTFYGLLQVIESLSLRAIEIPTHPREGIALEALQLACEQWPIKACIVVANYSNPLGYCMSDLRKQALVELINRHQIMLIEDDIYGDLGFGLQRPSTVKSWDSEGRVLYCSSFSKSLSPGLRVGWLVPGALYEKTEYLKYVTNLATPTLAQLIVAEVLEHGGYDRYLRRARQQYRQAVERMTAAVGGYFPPGTRITQPQGGFLLWVELPGKVDAITLTQQALALGISIAPGPIFSATQKYRNFIRLNCAVDWDERLNKALVTLGQLVQKKLNG
ncbi:MAG: PLP-dependent aminotransferase family protein [Methylomonas sp.]|jgi:DNA-binding transcriptional MocR family regulator|uniref:aminotransferase-like domain-containing protein n=1 Tax=Methylomonas sp. TaxID=418 RepID=UPI0025DFF2EA|nr:PLP-dependent aminotransferase family protein [Methylomonas sp.]MCK9605787.1 PLP-dependent aminotransferase family protein [Methylomonas sp.]